ncbi:hypothetical protein CSQ92_18500 [Janthinobacterium sp. BJB446]|nr:hypothetical protein CSQ92_18500 [Janthinobacterium sp. BJB446]
MITALHLAKIIIPIFGGRVIIQMHHRIFFILHFGDVTLIGIEVILQEIGACMTLWPECLITCPAVHSLDTNFIFHDKCTSVFVDMDWTEHSCTGWKLREETTFTVLCSDFLVIQQCDC